MRSPAHRCQALLAARRPAGHVIDCIGLTGDFRVRPLDTAEAHVGLVARCLANLRFESFLLLSSTRVYARADATHEDAAISLLSADPSDLYNLTKLAGEALCLACPRPEIRVARLSNVYGARHVGRDVPRSGAAGRRGTGSVVFHQSAASAKDYISIARVVRLLPAIAAAGRSAALQCRVRHATPATRTIADCLQRSCRLAHMFRTRRPTLCCTRRSTRRRLTAEFGRDRHATLPQTCRPCWH